MRPLSMLGLLVTLLAPGLDASAALVSFTSRAAWEAALPGTAVQQNEDFDYIIADADSITFDSGVVSAGVNPSGDARNRVTGSRYAATVNIDGTNGYDTITWTFPGPVIAFGADWFTTNTLDGATVSLAGSTFFFGDFLGSPGDGFLGFVNDTPFASVTFSTNGGTGNEFFQADDLTFVVVGEPAGIALFVLGAALAPVARRRQGGAGQESRRVSHTRSAAR